MLPTHETEQHLSRAEVVTHNHNEEEEEEDEEDEEDEEEEIELVNSIGEEKATWLPNPTTTVLADTPFDDPSEVDRRVRSEWLPGPPSHVELQQAEHKKHRDMRRDTQWQSTRIWSKGDKEKYMRARAAQERSIALTLKPDPFMVVESNDKEDKDQHRSRIAPWQDQFADHHLGHAHQFRTKMLGTGNLAAAIKSTI